MYNTRFVYPLYNLFLQLFNEIKIVNFTVDNETYITFDEKGDSSLGYEIIEWHSNGSEPIGEYRPKEKEIHLPEPLVSRMSNITVRKKCVCEVFFLFHKSGSLI